jgi:hypothetical protein
MNMNPDNQTLMLWLEDELPEDLKQQIDAWAADQPLWLEKRESARLWRGQLSQAMAEQELPYGDFFQSQLMRTIEQSRAASQRDVPPAVHVSPWRKFWLPASVAAAMVLGFIGGTQWQEKPHRAKTLVTYTPEEGVKAEFFETSPAEGTVIVLNGMAALPDSFVSTETTSHEPQHLIEPIEQKKETATLVAP